MRVGIIGSGWIAEKAARTLRETENCEAILSYLERYITPIDNAIQSATKQISLLQERKQIIINDIVIGKIKVYE